MCSMYSIATLNKGCIRVICSNIHLKKCTETIYRLGIGTAISRSRTAIGKSRTTISKSRTAISNAHIELWIKDCCNYTM
jgi:hypothetical protein